MVLLYAGCVGQGVVPHVQPTCAKLSPTASAALSAPISPCDGGVPSIGSGWGANSVAATPSPNPESAPGGGPRKSAPEQAAPGGAAAAAVAAVVVLPLPLSLPLCCCRRARMLRRETGGCTFVIRARVVCEPRRRTVRSTRRAQGGFVANDRQKRTVRDPPSNLRHRCRTSKATATAVPRRRRV